MFGQIAIKLRKFIRLYYLNRILAGILLWLSGAVTFFVLLVLLEQSLWLDKATKTILVSTSGVAFVVFWYRLVGRFFWKWIKPGFGMKPIDAAKLIADRDKTVGDQLVNLVQLTQSSHDSDLLEASIEQKSERLLPLDFFKTIDWSKAYKRALGMIPAALIVLIVLSVGGWSNFASGIDRVVKFRQTFTPPPPYSFIVDNQSLEGIANSDFELRVSVIGEQVPDRVFVNTPEGRFEMRKNRNGAFIYVFENITQSIPFFVESESVRSDQFDLIVVSPPKLIGLKMSLVYPKHTGRTAELVQSFQDLSLPEGTKVGLHLETFDTDRVRIQSGQAAVKVNSSGSVFEAEWKAFTNNETNVSLSNKSLPNYERFTFDVDVIKDAFPEIFLEQSADPLNWNELQFEGIASDDYAVVGLNLEYRVLASDNVPDIVALDFSPSAVVPFAASFPAGLGLEEGKTYEVRFIAKDNDGVHGGKSSSTQWYRYGVLTELEKREELLRLQNLAVEGLESVAKQNDIDQEALNEIQRAQLEKAQLSFAEKQKLKETLERQRQQDALMKSFNEATKKSLENQSKEFPNDPMSKALKKRIEEQEREINKNERLRDEIKKYAEKLNDLDLSERLEQLSKQKQSAQKSMAQVLELTKRYYVSQKAKQIGSSLEELAEKQEALADEDSTESNESNQESLKKSFQEILKQMDELQKENEGLKKPFDMKRDKATEAGVKQDQQSALDQLKRKESPKKQQSSAAKGMKKLAEQMSQMPMGGSGQQLTEDIEMLRQVLDNLLRFSFSQESLMAKFESQRELTSDFANLMQAQQDLKNNFKHVDDSLFILSLRQPMLSERINGQISDVYFYTDKALDRFADSQINEGVAAQQFVMNATNALADQLSDVLDNLNMQMAPNPGEGEGEMQLPDIIMSQEKLAEKMGKESDNKEGMRPKDSGEGKRSSGQGGEGDDAEGTFETYKEQQRLREAFERLHESRGGSAEGQNLLNEMEQLERDILNRVQSESIKKSMNNLIYEMLKFEEAEQLQGRDDQRESRTGKSVYVPDNEVFKLSKGSNSTIERLNRERLPLRPKITTKVNQYFIKEND
jgi:hypothetical protein